MGHGFEDPVGEIVHQGDEEVSAAHRRVADAKLQHARGGIARVEFGPVSLLQFFPALPFGDQRIERSDSFHGEWTDGFRDEELHQIVVRVVTPRSSAGETVGPGDQPLALRFQPVFEQAFVDATEMLHGHVPVVDPRAQHISTPRQFIDHQCELCVRYSRAGQDGRACVVEQPAVVRGKAQ